MTSSTRRSAASAKHAACRIGTDMVDVGSAGRRVLTRMSLLHMCIRTPQCCVRGRPTMPDVTRGRFIIDDGHDRERVTVRWAGAGQHCTLPRLRRGRKIRPAGEWQTTVTIIAQSPRARTRAAAGAACTATVSGRSISRRIARDQQGRGDVARLSTSDTSFYQLENTATPLYVGSLSILRQPRAGLSYETLLATVEQRLPKVPRYRQKVREVTMGLARPVWIDDRDFDITYHVRRSALPSPGSDEQLHELIGRLAARPLDKSRPLWEMYLVEGLAKNRLALYTKSHQALINGMGAVEIGHVIADRNRRPPPFVEDIWVPAREPGPARLLLGAIGDWATRPRAQLRAVRTGVTELATNSGQLVDVGRRMFDVARTFARGTAPSSPLNTTVSRNRRFTVARGRLDDYRAIRARYNCDVNDVVLAVITGALRNWLLSRGEAAAPAATVRAMAPLPVYVDETFDSSSRGQAISAGSALSGRPAGRGGQRRRTAVADRARHRIQPDRGQPGRCPNHRDPVGFCAADLARHGYSGRD